MASAFSLLRLGYSRHFLKPVKHSGPIAKTLRKQNAGNISKMFCNVSAHGNNVMFPHMEIHMSFKSFPAFFHNVSAIGKYVEDPHVVCYIQLKR